MLSTTRNREALRIPPADRYQGLGKVDSSLQKHVMRKLILHVGMPKTGTTSIQSTLFRNTPDKRFRFISLDCVFGNRCALGGFTSRDRPRFGFFSETIPKWYYPILRRSSKAYLTRALRACAKDEVIPIFSAEIIWYLDQVDLRAISAFLNAEGYRPEVYGYLRAPLDFCESVFQQMVKIGRCPSLENSSHLGSQYCNQINSLQCAFGKEHVRLKVFDPKSFPQRCVVRDFCSRIGMNFGDAKVIRENESINGEVTKLLYAWNRVHSKNVFGWYPRLKRRMVLESLQDLAGKPLRFHASLAKDLEAGLPTDVKEIQDENERVLPLSIADREAVEGIATIDDLLQFSEETLQWLADRTNHQRVDPSDPTERLQKVVDQLSYFSWWRYPGILGRLLWNEMRLRWERMWKKRRMQVSS